MLKYQIIKVILTQIFQNGGYHGEKSRLRKN